MEVDHREVRPPDDLRDLGHAELVGVPSGGERDARDLDPLGPLLGHALLVDLLARDPVREAPELRRPLAQRADDPVADREVVVDEVALRVPGVGEQHLVGVRHLDERASRPRARRRARPCPRPYSALALTFRNEVLRRRCGSLAPSHVTLLEESNACGSCSIPSLVLAAAAALAVAATATGARSAAAAPAAIPGCAAGSPQPRRGRHAHDRRRQPGLPAVVRRRREDEAVEGLRPVQRQGLRVGRRVRGREAARLHEGAGEVDGRAVQQLVPPGQEVVRLLPHPGLVHAGAGEGGRLLEVVLLRQPGGRRPQGHSRSRRSKSIAGLKPYKLGAQVGTTSYTYITRYIRPSSSPLVYDTNDAAVQALKNGQIDGIVVDLPTAFYVTAVQVDDGVDRRQAADEGHEGALRDRLPEGQHAAPLRRTGRSPGCGANGTIKKLQNDVPRAAPARLT